MIFAPKILFSTLALLLTAGELGTAKAGPRAEISNTAWQLDIAFYDPQRITVRSSNGQETTYWYVLYQVTNKTGKDIDFFPSFSLVTDTTQTLDAGAGVPPNVYDSIAARHKPEYPFFWAPGKLIGPLLQGEENARVSAAVFRGFDPTAAKFTIYMSGFSGAIDRQTNPSFDPKKPESPDNPRAFVLRRTLSVTYSLPGDPQTRSLATPVRISREWVNR